MAQDKDSVTVATEFSARQMQLIALLAEGKSNKEIADELRIAYGTVKQHLVVLFRKMAVPNRSRAALIAQRLVRDGPRVEGGVKATEVIAAPYQWRMLSAIAITLPELTSGGDPRNLVGRNEALALLHRYVRQLMEALDGRTMPAPCGGIIGWLGYPRAHQDDADRMIETAAKVQAFASQHAAMYPIFDAMGIGLANLAEMVEEDSPELYSVKIFSIAMALAKDSQQTKYPLATPLTARLAHLPVHWLKLRRTQPGDTEGRVNSVLALAKMHTHAPELLRQWGGLPFIQSLCSGVSNGLAQWVSVSSWPLSTTPFLLSALAAAVREQGVRVIDVRLPTRKSRHVLMSSFFQQLEGLERFSFDPRRTAGERLAGLIRYLAGQQPLCLLIHGQDGLQVFRQALTDKGVEQLVSHPVMIIGQSTAEDKPEAVVRSLGPRANGKPFSRAYVLQVPEFENVMDRLRLDVRSLLDGLAPLARRVVVQAAHRPDQSISGAVGELAEPVYQVQEALQQLQASGLIQPGETQAFEFRDPLLPRAICEQDVDLNHSE